MVSSFEVFFTKTLHAILMSPMHATCHIYFIFLDLIIIIFGQKYKLRSPSLHIFFFHFPVTSSFFCLNIFPSLLFSDALNSHFPLTRVSYTYKPTGKVTVCVFIVTFLGRRRQDWRFPTEWCLAFTEFNLHAKYLLLRRRSSDVNSVMVFYSFYCSHDINRRKDLK